MRGLTIALLASATLSACTTAPEPRMRSAEAEAQLTKMLAGKVAGAPLNCLPSLRADNMTVIDDNTVLFRDGRTVYRNDFNGLGCNRLGNGYTLVTRTTGSSLCSGDIAQVVDLASGMQIGGCAFGEFVPYRPSAG
jgi:hypothetical protein